MNNTSTASMRHWYLLSWWLVSAMLISGVLVPMFTFTKFYFFDDTFSLASGIFHLLDEGEPLLFAIVFAFSMLMPAYKMLLLYQLISAADSGHTERHQRHLRRLGLIGKWSMLDVFVLAILIVTVKLGAIAQVQIHFGLYLFSLAVIASMILTQLVQMHADRLYERNHE